MPKTGVVKDYRYLEHITGDYHPESHQRLEVIYERLEEEDAKNKFLLIEPRFATHEELEYVHIDQYIAQVEGTAGKPLVMLDSDTQTSPKSWEAAKLAVGGVLTMIDKLMKKEIDNGFALIRPPGHHAESDRAMGFCLFNNVAIGAEYAIKEYGLDRILIIDWDLHHGNGTQHTFYDDSRVLYFSTHQYPYYPGTGNFNEIGSGDGKGFTVNIPLSPGPGDDEYAKIYLEILKPITLEYKPEMILVSAGFDIYHQDPLGGMGVTPEGFARLTRIIMELAELTCRGRVLLALEGGYHLDGLRDSVWTVLRELGGESGLKDGESILEKKIENSAIVSVIERVKTIHQAHWQSLG